MKGPGLQVWGGVEATIARIGDGYRDQAAETGHATRAGDLEAVAALGIEVLRYPALWESISPHDPGQADFSWHDRRFDDMGRLGLEPVVGLCHHGSGPRYTHLLDPAFPVLLARHALNVAERYPHVRQYTPVNEPATTARFSLLYGHWYPHERDHAAFLRGLVNECRATQEAMRAIRRVRADAKLVQTEDIGRTFSTPMLRYQADHDNERRWLTFDLLLGRVDRRHVFWPALIAAGVRERDLDVLCEADAAPDVIGVNHYLTSDRYLDQRRRRYPQPHWGGNGRHRFADVEAVRIDLPDGSVGPAARLQEVWDRYGLPMVVSEVHHGCTRDEQLRWLAEVWDAASRLRGAGADIRAVTVWALFGLVDWNSLLVRRDRSYEPGAYDARATPPRLTALGKACRDLAARGRIDHPVVDEAGWWRRGGRFYRAGHAGRADPAPRSRPLLLVGPHAVARLSADLCRGRGLRVETVSALDESDAAIRPWAVMMLEGLSAPGATAPARTTRSREAEQICRRAGIPLLTFSAGHHSMPDDAAGVRDAPDAAVLEIRTGIVFGTLDEADPALALSRCGPNRAPSHGLDHAPFAASYWPDLLHAALDLLIDGERGVWTLANTTPPDFSWRLFAERLAHHAAGGGAAQRGAEAPPAIDRGSRRRLLLPDIDCALGRFTRQVEASPRGDTVRKRTPRCNMDQRQPLI